MQNKKIANYIDKISNIDIFHPYILIIFTLLYLIVSIPVVYFTSKLPHPTMNVYIYMAIGLIFLVLGVQFSKLIIKKGVNKELFKDLNTNSITSKFKIAKLKLKDHYDLIEKLLIIMVLIGIVLQIINFTFLGGIPLFSGRLKIYTATKLWLFSYIFFLIGINLLLAKYNRKIHYLLLVIGLGLFALTGYRTTPIVIILSIFITLFYTRDFKIKHYLVFTLIAIFLLIVIGFIAVKSIQWQHWDIGPLELISYRAGFTLNILDKAIQSQGATGGNLAYYTLTGFFNSVDPRVLVGGTVTTKVHSLTSTIFGPAILDFGLLGMIIQMFSLGFILKTLHTLQKHFKYYLTAFYGILLAQTIVWIETGPTDLVVWIFYLIAIVLMIYTIIKSNKENKEKNHNTN
ncbi:oligosaccharide repeat unit polymerase family protein [Methanobrevibacter filiformis]|uniref:Oligosaccharide repeat unit polymerase n=1 Tax=Methanobrevibacter filiformis TaxID=55758 RepID=A0A166ESW6_9EURY|nr:oligosaccharide repeat unit polymerase family protein [Methanobrevibacter filiformis]KZX16975.1 hypothetical protein MBFIL_04250 [Methanobrevibacter filiformis]